MLTYWVVCFVPDTVRPDRVGAGIIVTNRDHTSISARFTLTPEELPPISAGRTAFLEGIRRFGEELTTIPPQQAVALVERTQHNSYGVLQILPGALAAGEDTETMAEELYARMIHRPSILSEKGRELTPRNDKPTPAAGWEDTLHEIAGLKDGWMDGAGDTIHPSVINAARYIMKTLSDTAPALPVVFPTPHGGIQLQHHTPDKYIEVMIHWDDEHNRPHYEGFVSHHGHHLDVELSDVGATVDFLTRWLT